MRHSPVPIQTHGGEGEYRGVHGEKVQAQDEAAAKFPEGPSRGQAVVHDEGRGEKVEQIRKGEAQHLEVKRGGGRGGRRGGGGRGVGEAGWDGKSSQAAGRASSASPPAAPQQEA